VLHPGDERHDGDDPAQAQSGIDQPLNEARGFLDKARLRERHGDQRIDHDIEDDHKGADQFAGAFGHLFVRPFGVRQGEALSGVALPLMSRPSKKINPAPDQARVCS